MTIHMSFYAPSLCSPNFPLRTFHGIFQSLDSSLQDHWEMVTPNGQPSFLPKIRFETMQNQTIPLVCVKAEPAGQEYT